MAKRCLFPGTYPVMKPVLGATPGSSGARNNETFVGLNNLRKELLGFERTIILTPLRELVPQAEGESVRDYLLRCKELGLITAKEAQTC